MATPPGRRVPHRVRVHVALAALALVGSLTLPDAHVPQLQPGHDVVDALEHPDLATLEGPDGRSLAVPRSWLPEGVGEGDLLTVRAAHAKADASVRFEIDAAATEERRRALQRRRDDLPSVPAGDLEL